MHNQQHISVSELLSRYAEKRLYLHEVSGNNGDELILHGSRLLLRRSGCELVDSPDAADVLLINGGFKSDFWPFANETIREFSEKHPEKPLVVLPSSFLYRETDFASLFEGRSAGVVIFAREEPSLRLVRELRFGCDVEFGLDHDTAFALSETPEIQRLRDIEPDIDALVVERGDAERVSDFREGGVLESTLVKRVASALLPDAVKSRAAMAVGKRRRAQSAKQLTGFASAALALAESELGRALGETLIDDISRRSSCDYAAFCEQIARSRVVISTRLHVAVLAAVLGRRTFIVQGRYHKIPGIYAYSMRDMPHVSMVNASCEVVE